MKLQWNDKERFPLEEFRETMEELLFTKEPFISEHKIQAMEGFCLASGGSFLPVSMREPGERRYFLDSIVSRLADMGLAPDYPFCHAVIDVAPDISSEYGTAEFYEFFATYAGIVSEIVPVNCISILVPHIHQYGEPRHIHYVYSEPALDKFGKAQLKVITGFNPTVRNGQNTYDIEQDLTLLTDSERAMLLEKALGTGIEDPFFQN